MSDEIDIAPTPATVPDGPPEVTILGQTVQLAEPSALLSVAVSRSREEILSQDWTASLALGAAALRGCWPAGVAWPVRPAPAPWRVGMRAMDYGAPIYEQLAASTRKGGQSRSELHGALIAALNYAVGAGHSAADIERAQDFSEAPGAD